MYVLNASITNTQQSGMNLVESETERSVVIKWKSFLCYVNVIARVAR